MHAASLIYLEVDLVLVLCYVGAQLSGCKWIQMSDLFRCGHMVLILRMSLPLFRWYREGRFSITRTQLVALGFSTVWTRENHFKIPKKREWIHYEAVSSASLLGNHAANWFLWGSQKNYFSQFGWFLWRERIFSCRKILFFLQKIGM